MTATTRTPVDTVAAPALLDRYRDACTVTDAPLDTFIVYLRELAKADLATLAPDITDPDVARAVAVGYVQGTLQVLAAHLTSRFDAEVRSAPPAALGEVVRDAAVECRNETCDEKFLPWQEECCGCCSDECCAEQTRRES
jgi:hypothetical protein